VLQVWGRHDRLVPSRRITQSEGTVMLAGCGHCPQLDSPDQLLEAVVPFLAADAASAVPDLLARAAGS
jgi:pimeloyl-ACP methyl ester carboxylesterase